jgi:hypothetical protein
MNKNAKAFIVASERIFGREVLLTREGIKEVCNESGAPYPYWLVTKEQYRAGRGQYKVPPSGENITKQTVVEQPETEVALAAQVLEFRQPKLIDDSDVSIPQKYPDYVPFGFYKDLTNVI